MAEFKEGDKLRHLVTGESVVVVAVDSHEGKTWYTLTKVVKSLPTEADEIEGRYKKEQG